MTYQRSRGRRARRTAAALAAIVVLVAACGGDSDDDAEGVASIAAQSNAVTVSGSPEDTAGTGEDALIAYTECMRTEGIDMPDPQFDADGNLVNGIFDEVDTESDEYQAAQDVCGGLLDSAVQELGEEVDTAALQDAMLAFSDCLRGEGLDVGDIPVDGDTGGDSNQGTGAGQGGSAGNPAAGSGPGDVLGEGPEATAEVFGLDPDDPAVIAGIETCQPALNEALLGIQDGA
jgi:hypothetical protein